MMLLLYYRFKRKTQRSYVTLDDWEEWRMAKNDPVLHPLEIKRSIKTESLLLTPNTQP